MTSDRLKEIRGRLSGITEGPWLDDDIRTVYGPKYPVCQVMGADASNYDRKFIAHSRQDIPDLLAALDETRELLKEAMDLLHGSVVFSGGRDSDVCHYCRRDVDSNIDALDESHDTDCDFLIWRKKIDAVIGGE